MKRTINGCMSGAWRSLLLFSVLILMGFSSFASHFVYGNISWERIPGSPNMVHITVTQSYRLSEFPDAAEDATYNDHTDLMVTGSPGGPIPIILTVTDVDEDDAIFTGTFETDVVISTNSTFVASFSDHGRYIYLQNNADLQYTITAEGTLNGNDAPFPDPVEPIITLPPGSLVTYQLSVTDPNNDILTFSKTPGGDFGNNTTQPTILTNVSSTGLLTFNTAGKTPGQLYNANITVTDGNGAKIQLDFIIRIGVPGVNTPPFFDYAVTPADGASYTTMVGTPVTFTVKAADNDFGDQVTVTASGLPAGAVFNAAGAGNPKSVNFSWTPTAASPANNTITFTATDKSNVSVSTVVNIKVNAGRVPCTLPGDLTVNVTTNDNFCSYKTYSAAANITGGTSYTWTYNNVVFATTPSISLNQASGAGIYTVVATNGTCTSAPASINFMPQGLMNIYGMLAFKSVKLGEDNHVYNASVGVTRVKGKIDIKKYSSVASPGAVVRASKIKVKDPSNVPTRIYSPATVTLPTMIYNTVTNYGNTNATATTTNIYAGNYKEIKIKSGVTATLTGDTFEKIKMEKNSKVIFSGNTTVNVKNIEMDEKCALIFNQNTKMLVADKVKVDKSCTVNPSGQQVTFYMGDLKKDHEKFSVKGKGTNVIANIYMPKGNIKVNGEDHDSCNMTGIYIAEKISSGKHVNWNSFDCANPLVLQIKRANPVMDAKYQVLVFPNPSVSDFEFQIRSSSEEAVSIRIVDVYGRTVAQATTTINTAIHLGEGLATGNYFAEVSQGSSRQVVKLIKLN